MPGVTAYVIMRKANELLRREIEKRPRGTQAALARAVGVKPQTITKWVRGDTRIPSEHWAKIEEALELKPMAIAYEVGGEALVEALSPSDVDDVLLARSPATAHSDDQLGDAAVTEILAAIDGAAASVTDVLENIQDRLTRIERHLARRAGLTQRGAPGSPSGA